MLKAILDFFDTNLRPNQDASHNQHRLDVATAALLIEVARMDTHISDLERDMVFTSVRAKFSLTEQESTALIELAQAEAKQATDYYQFTTLINQHFSPEQKHHVIEQLWQVAYADNKLDMYEEHYIRKIADLLYVPHAQYIAAKLKVRDTAR